MAFTKPDVDNLWAETVVEGLAFLVSEGILTEERKEEILNTVPEESELYVG